MLSPDPLWYHVYVVTVGAEPKLSFEYDELPFLYFTLITEKCEKKERIWFTAAF